VEPDALLPEVDDYMADSIDTYLNAEVVLPRGGIMSKGKVVKRCKDSDLKPIGLRNENPVLDTREYAVEFEDGETSTYQANLVLEHLHASVDEHSMLLQLMTGVIDHRSDGRAVRKDDGFIKSESGNSVPRKTTVGWDLLIEWKDGTTSWLALKDIKDSYSVQVAEYAVNNKIAEEPAFSW